MLSATAHVDDGASSGDVAEQYTFDMLLALTGQRITVSSHEDPLTALQLKAYLGQQLKMPPECIRILNGTCMLENSAKVTSGCMLAHGDGTAAYDSGQFKDSSVQECSPRGVSSV
eukprot:gnl/TRDRNA2_/TRDRNA2_86399_c0_seq3.p2 gnl/TRDRNA2_/TRDRNA2_86399_c0~~gnl/TRDRNA2_/TRDRNA2_86399_c0_seq3.p2  ORF type:complete len:115 (-),score=21.30 gnl/TRDRNA2_/TRDRNA2_86399_c0_seq3:355-699(-)